MRKLSLFLTALAILFCQAPRAWAEAEPILDIVFSGNTWGYLKPCPS
jgi:hypothetical protein